MTREPSGEKPDTKQPTEKPRVIVHAEQCKGCGRCVISCPVGNLAISQVLNRNGYRTAAVVKMQCRGCGLCYYSCPEPGAITVVRGGGADDSESRSGE